MRAGPGPPGSQASTRGEAKDAALLSSRDAGLLEPPEYDGDLSLPLGLALGSPIFPSGCEGKLGVALESLQGSFPSPGAFTSSPVPPACSIRGPPAPRM